MAIDNFLRKEFSPDSPESWYGWRKMNNGLMARCIAFRSVDDMDIEFENGIIVRHRSKRNFLEGAIRCIEYRCDEILGLEKEMKNGKVAKCIAYFDSQNIDVQFEDGTIVRTSKYNFDHEIVAYPRDYSDRVGKRVFMNCKEWAECIAYRKYDDLDIRFDSGVERYGVRWQAFLAGNVSKVAHGLSLVGIEVYMHCGMSAICIADRGCEDIDICFDDDTVVSGTTRYLFLHGQVANPNVSRSDYPYNSCTRLVGETKQMNCGYICTVVRDASSTDIDVEFEDGAVVEHTKRSMFLFGSILHPNLGYLWTIGDSIAQRVLYYYICKFYNNVGYRVKLNSLKADHGRRYEIDIFLWELGIGIEFDGPVPNHQVYSRSNIKKNELIESSYEINRLFVVRDNDPRIVTFSTPKIKNIMLASSRGNKRLECVYEAAKIILEDLGNDVSSLSWNPDIVSSLYSLEDITLCRHL